MSMRIARLVALAAALAVCAAWAMAQSSHSDEWTVSPTETGPYAGTRTTDGAFFQKRCFYERIPCAWIVHAPSLTCANEAEFTFALVADGQRADIRATCDVEAGPAYLFILKDAAAVERALDGATQLQVLIPAGNGEYFRLDFSLDGMPAALSRLAGAMGEVDGSSNVDGSAKCRLLWNQYAACKRQVEEALKKCAVWAGPGPCPYLGPVCLAPNCSP
jgi:hypothetical protein